MKYRHRNAAKTKFKQHRSDIIAATAYFDANRGANLLMDIKIPASAAACPTGFT